MLVMAFRPAPGIQSPEDMSADWFRSRGFTKLIASDVAIAPESRGECPTIPIPTSTPSKALREGVQPLGQSPKRGEALATKVGSVPGTAGWASGQCKYS